MLSIAKYGLIVVAPTPTNTAKECVSKESEHSTFMEQYPLSPFLIKCEWTAPTARTLGILAFLLEIFLSESIKVVHPSLTAVSQSSLICSILSFKDEEISNVQSITLVFFEKNFLNFSFY